MATAQWELAWSKELKRYYFMDKASWQGPSFESRSSGSLAGVGLMGATSKCLFIHPRTAMMEAKQR